jgi:hypothetical protein
VTISYPLDLPSVGYAGIGVIARDVVGSGTSPFTLSTQVQQHDGQGWALEIDIPPMVRADAEEWIAFLLSLKGRYGTFLARDGVSANPRGSWAGAPLVDGVHAARASALNLKGLTAGATIKKGDYLQLGSGTSTRLHKSLIDATASGAGLATIDIWPNLREALAGNEAVVTTNARGTFRLADNARRWDITTAMIFGLQFSAVEAL